MGPRDLHNATLARTNPAFPCPVGAGQRPAHKTRTRSGERRRTCSTHTLPDPCAPAGGAALPVRVTPKLCLPFPSWAAQRESGDGASMSLLLSNMTLPFRRETARTNWRSSPKVIPKRRLLVRQNSTSAVPGSGTTCIRMHVEFPGGQTRESGTAPNVSIRHMPRERPKPRYLSLQRRKTGKKCYSSLNGPPTQTKHTTT